MASHSQCEIMASQAAMPADSHESVFLSPSTELAPQAVIDINFGEFDSNTTDDSQRQSKQLPRGRESREWISEKEWRIHIEQKFGVDLPRSPSDVSIFRVPNFLKESRKGEAYVPKIVSLGPYHHRDAQLLPMNNHKKKALRRMTTRCKENYLDFFSSAKKKILQLKDEIGKIYEEKIDCCEENLALMLCLDGCFILEILRTLGSKPGEGASNYYEPIFEKNRIDYTGFHIMNDILMLENQIPLIVLRKLLKLELKLNSNDVERELFKVLVEYPVSKFYPFSYDVSKWQPQPHEQVHLLGLLHGLIVSPPCADQNKAANDGAEQDKSDVRRIPRAVELRNAGIKFEKCATNEGIKQIRFKQESATICLPRIDVTDHTEVLFRNLIALEVCKPSKINYVTCYLSLMDELIDSGEDVGVLRESEIVANYLGSDEEVAKLLNDLCIGVTLSRADAFKEMKKLVHDHYKSKFMVWSAELAKEYFSSPWRSLAVAGAIFALLLSILQTIFSIIAVYK